MSALLYQHVWHYWESGAPPGVPYPEGAVSTPPPLLLACLCSFYCHLLNSGVDQKAEVGIDAIIDALPGRVGEVCDYIVCISRVMPFGDNAS